MSDPISTIRFQISLANLLRKELTFESWQKLNFMIRLSAAETETRKIANIGKQCSDNNDLNQCSGGSAENWSVAKV